MTILQRDYRPTIGWKTAEPQDMGMLPARLEQMQAHIHEHIPF